ncbi:hypothetical protein F4604DRAFT_1937534 [Suillus subluteus]|nr:hypothetical protein F4604DRAFT_1937534 [Suillus subluteus]
MTVVPPTDKPRDPSPADDYVNATYVQPLGTRKHYIAMQGPLPATFVDFWTLIENAMLLNTSPPVSPSTSSNTSTDIGFFMSPCEHDKGLKQPSMIVRTFALSHRSYPSVHLEE